MVCCNLCGYEGDRFIDWDDGYGNVYPDSTCPTCASQHRHRSLVHYLKQAIPTNRKVKLLHFSPAYGIAEMLKSYKNVDYYSSDIVPESAMFVEDLRKLSFKDNSFDIIICIHVLEHIDNDIGAMKEIYRVLKHKGFAIIEVPIYLDREKTYEDF